MRLLPNEKSLSEEFDEILKSAEKIDLATAWLPDSPMLTKACNKLGKNLRIIAGISIGQNNGFISDPKALKKANTYANIRICEPEKGIFHPKLYIFHLKSKKTMIWIGSANFSYNGFGCNDELMMEINSDTEEAKNWFNTRWSNLENQNTVDIIKNYEASSTIKYYEKHGVLSVPLPSQNNLAWQAFYDGIQAFAPKWSVDMRDPIYKNLGMIESYIQCIDAGHNLIKNSLNIDFDDQHLAILFGLDVNSKTYPLLGLMKGRNANPRNFMKRDAKTRNIIFTALQHTINTNNQQDYLKSVSEALDTIMNISGFGIGIASRFLTLARPDMAVSLNGSSYIRLASYTGMVASTIRQSQQSYIELLKRLYETSWHNTDMPHNINEQAIWQRRMAFLDIYAYEKNNIAMPSK